MVKRAPSQMSDGRLFSVFLSGSRYSLTVAAFYEVVDGHVDHDEAEK